MRVLAFAFAAVLLAVPAAGRAQAPSGDQGDVELSIKRAPRPPFASAVRPVTPPQVIEHGVAEAQAEAERFERQQQLLETVRPAPPRRPDLQQDVVGGIQSRNLQRSLGR